MDDFPTLQALLIADQVYQERAGKHIIAGTFSQVRSAAFPMRHGPSHLYVALTDIFRPLSLSFKFVSTPDDDGGAMDEVVLMDASTTQIRCSDPTVLVEVGIPVPYIPLPKPGMYRFELLVNGDVLGQLKLEAVQVVTSTQVEM